MKELLILGLALLTDLGVTFNARAAESTATPAPKKVYILPIRDDIMPPLVYVVRRGVKEAMEAKADVLILDMETNGGSVRSMMEIIQILGQFKGQTVTFVNSNAFSAGALMSFATAKIYMAPGSVIGAAAPVMAAPGGGGVEAMSDTMEVKSASAISALIRANAEKYGHNTELVDAMVKKTKELKIDGKVLNEKGQILTLTNMEAEREYGQPPKPLLSSGTVESLDALLKKLNLEKAERVRIEPTGMEKLATWITAISPILLIIGMAGIYIEFKTPGFGLPGIVGIIAFAIYFFGGYVAGLSGVGWVAVFALGLVLVGLELFFFPGTIALGLTGTALMLAAVIMAMVDMYPGPGPGLPSLPTVKQLTLPMNDLLIAIVGSAVTIWLLSLLLPHTSFYSRLVSQTASGVESEHALAQQQTSRLGLVGVALSNLRPGGKAQFGEQILDVMSQGELIEKGRPVRIIGNRGTEAVVELAS